MNGQRVRVLGLVLVLTILNSASLRAGNAALLSNPSLVYSVFPDKKADFMEDGHNVAVDAAGNAYIVGIGSLTAPTWDVQPLVYGDAMFIIKLNAAGNAMIYGVLIRGLSGQTTPYAIAVDGDGQVYVTGSTRSSNFPTKNAFQPVNPKPGGWYDTAFVIKINAAGNDFIYSTFLGGAAYTAGATGDRGQGIAVDGDGNAYVTGIAETSDFPTTPAAFQTKMKGNTQAFVTKFSPQGGLAYSTYLGGSSGETASDIAVDQQGQAYITGGTSSQDFPATTMISPKGYIYEDVFVAKFNPSGSTLIYAMVWGGKKREYGQSITIDAAGSAYISGSTYSTDLPLKNPLQSSKKGEYDAFVAKLNPAGNGLVYSTYLGGGDNDYGYGIRVDAVGNAYVFGETSSSDFPLKDPLQTTITGQTPILKPSDAFLTKINPAGTAMVYSTYLGGSDWDHAGGLDIDNRGNAYLTGYSLSSDFPTQPVLPPEVGDKVYLAKITDSSPIPTIGKRIPWELLLD